MIRPARWLRICLIGVALGFGILSVQAVSVALGQWIVVTEGRVVERVEFLPSFDIEENRACLPWTQVNQNAFGMDGGGDASYKNEEGFEVLVSQGHLYLGMEADNLYGARLWRTKSGIVNPQSQKDWEEVIADENGLPYGNPVLEQVDHIDSLASFDGYIYASVANRSGTELGTQVYRSVDGSQGTWQVVVSDGFGESSNTNFKDMLVFTPTIQLNESVNKSAMLCGGVGNEKLGVQVYCSQDGLEWRPTSPLGFGKAGNILIASMIEHEGGLYVGVVNEQGGSLWRTLDLALWERVFVTDAPRIEALASFEGNIYIASGAFDGRLPETESSHLQLYRSTSGDAGKWLKLEAPPTYDHGNTRGVVDSAVVYNGALLLATMNMSSGTEVWRSADGRTWNQENSDGFGTATSFAAQLTVFNGYLYAWTSDYFTGQRVMRSGCSEQQTLYAAQIYFPNLNTIPVPKHTVR